MSVSDADYLAWLRSDHVRCVIVEMQCHDGAGVVTRYLSTVPYTSAATDTPASQPYDEVIVGVPTVRMAYGESLAVGNLEIDNAAGVYDTWLDDAFDGRPISVRLGDPAWPLADFRPLLTGVIDHLTAGSHDTLIVAIRDRKEALNGPIQTSLYSSGPALGSPKPLALGVLHNIEPVLINSTLPPVYQVHDGGIYGVFAVRIGGGVVPPGNYTVDNAAGTVTLILGATARVTMDVYGQWDDAHTAPITRLTDIIRWIAARAAPSVPVDEASLAALAAAMGGDPYDIHGYYIRGRENAAAVITALCASAGCDWSFSRSGALRVWRLDAPTGTAALELDADDIVFEGLAPTSWQAPVKAWRVGSRLNWTIQDRDAMSPLISVADRELYGQEYLTILATYAPGAGNHLGATEPDTVSTYLSNATAAQAEANRLGTLRGVQRRRYAVQIAAPSLPVELGDEVRITYPRFGFAAGANAIVVGIDESASDGRTTLEVWR